MGVGAVGPLMTRSRMREEEEAVGAAKELVEGFGVVRPARGVEGGIGQGGREEPGVGERRGRRPRVGVWGTRDVRF